MAHAVLEQLVVVNRRRYDFLVAPPFKDRHCCVFNGPTQACFGTDVVTHSGWDSGNHCCSSVGSCQLSVVLWSWVLGLGPLDFGLWTLDFGPPTTFPLFPSSLFNAKNPPPICVGSGFLEIVFSLLRLYWLAQE